MLINGRRINRIVASGCSFTYGDELANRQTETWLAQLAQLCNVEPVNLAFGGMGNEHISRTLIDYFVLNPTHMQDSFVIPCFSTFNRVEFPHRNPQGKPWTTLPMSIIEPEFTKMFFETYYQWEYYYTRYLRIIIGLQNTFKAWDIPYLMCEGVSGNDHNQRKQTEIIVALKNQIDKSTWLDFFINNIDTLTDPKDRAPRGHPTAKAYGEFAALLHQHLINNYKAEI